MNCRTRSVRIAWPQALQRPWPLLLCPGNEASEEVLQSGQKYVSLLVFQAHQSAVQRWTDFVALEPSIQAIGQPSLSLTRRTWRHFRSSNRGKHPWQQVSRAFPSTSTLNLNPRDLWASAHAAAAASQRRLGTA